MTISPSPIAAQTFVLVHGAYHGGWCYRRVADLLRSMGHRVFTPTLSGLAERSRENSRPINCTTHINEVVDLFEWEELDDVVLVGHSYGGMVVGGVADRIPHRIRNLVYLDAVIPENGKSMADYVFPGESLLEVINDVGVAGGLIHPAHPDGAAFFNVNEADRALVDRLCTPQPMASLLEKLELGVDGEAVKSHTYIYATNWGFPPIDQTYARAKTLPGWDVHEIESGHDIMLDAPVQLSEILRNLS
ncbi:alpha/beta fold hydrolase [Arthrobacter sp. efr-133-TYG-118]|uniref:alpha/beta fold hydrolase n=1 Tax=Arthrobacter sp. efr-133-TYG-118 TaxID=3040279 RepID=UPI00254C4F5A|nr:alpha/beta fold hydrolase [Arthrobacter sp. efr-133-TYG-118]